MATTRHINVSVRFDDALVAKGTYDVLSGKIEYGYTNPEWAFDPSDSDWSRLAFELWKDTSLGSIETADGYRVTTMSF